MAKVDHSLPKPPNQRKNSKSQRNQVFLEETKRLRELIKTSERNSYFHSIPFSDNRLSVSEKIRAEKQALENEAFRQDMKLKKMTLLVLFLFLAAETIVIFVFAYFQATKLFGFSLEEWSFKLLVTATISQITWMVQLAVKHLFPTQKK